jgi:hypothetical protein
MNDTSHYPTSPSDRGAPRGGVEARIWPVPVEIKNPIRLNRDDQHRAWMSTPSISSMGAPSCTIPALIMAWT